MLDRHQREMLDRHITGNYGEDQFKGFGDPEPDEEPCEKCGGTGARLVAGEPVWQEPCGECSGEGVVPKPLLSQCCGALPHQIKPDVSDEDPTGVCGRCHEHTVFERSDKDAPQ